MAKQLTAPTLLKLRPSDVRREVRDGGAPGLHLIIQPTGAKSWALRFRRPNGKTAKLTLGPLDVTGDETDAAPCIGAPLTLAAARRLANQLHHEKARGKDIVAVRHTEKLELKARGAKTFAQAAIDFINQYAKRETRRWQETARLLGLDPKDAELKLIEKGLAHRWKDRPLAEIDGDDVHAVVAETREKGAPGLERRADGPTEARARAMLSALSTMFGWLVKERRLRQNPCADVSRPAPSVARDRVLIDLKKIDPASGTLRNDAYAEIAKFWRATEAERVEFGALLRLLLLTGARLNEVAQMRRDELSDDGTTWTIPATRTKNHREHAVPLPPLASEILSSVKTSGELVFTTNGRDPVAGWSKIKDRLDEAMRVKPWRLHDLRRTCATGMAELGIAPHVVEACLNHVSGHKAGVAGTYNRAGYASEKKAAFERWAAHVAGLLSDKPTADITSLAARRHRQRGAAP